MLTAAHRGEPITCGVCSAVVAVDDTVDVAVPCDLVRFDGTPSR